MSDLTGSHQQQLRGIGYSAVCPATLDDGSHYDLPLQTTIYVVVDPEIGVKGKERGEIKPAFGSAKWLIKHDHERFQ
jgi:hypothetical protein